MKNSLSVPRTAFLAFALGTAGVTASFAQTTTTPSTTPAPATCTDGGKHHHGSVLTPDEKAQLQKAYTAVLAADPSLQTDKDNLKQQFEKLKGEGSSATRDDWKAFHEQARAFHEKLKNAELAQDSTLAPIFAKLEAAGHKHWHHSAEGNTDASQT